MGLPLCTCNRVGSPNYGEDVYTFTGGDSALRFEIINSTMNMDIQPCDVKALENSNDSTVTDGINPIPAIATVDSAAMSPRRRPSTREEEQKVLTEHTRTFLKHAITGIDISLLDETAFGGKISAILTINPQLTVVTISKETESTEYQLTTIDNVLEGEAATKELEAEQPDLAFWIRHGEREHVVRMECKVPKGDLRPVAENGDNDTSGANVDKVVWFVYSPELGECRVRSALEVLRMCAVVTSDGEASESTMSK
eukprot:GEMP01063430.1.p1 GENE.GEMP01063430.1~~GEMP01063430.1.p1  ORF type:complete len:255 (+),score=52.14 GEMP01063430.1:98-862(+)